MPGYEWRVGVRKMPVPGFNEYCGTEQGINTHKARSEPLCDSCSELRDRHSNPIPTERTRCPQGHDATLMPPGRCYECLRTYMRERVTCQTCDTNVSRGSIGSHRKHHEQCFDARFADAA